MINSSIVFEAEYILNCGGPGGTKGPCPGSGKGGIGGDSKDTTGKSKSTGKEAFDRSKKANDLSKQVMLKHKKGEATVEDHRSAGVAHTLAARAAKEANAPRGAIERHLRSAAMHATASARM